MEFVENLVIRTGMKHASRHSS